MKKVLKRSLFLKKTQSLKTKFRSSKEWKTFRKDLKKSQKIDPITLKRLTTRANCHHRDLNENHYTDLSNPSHFVMYNPQTHDTIHFLYNIVVRDGLEETLERLRKELLAMLEVNHV